MSCNFVSRGGQSGEKGRTGKDREKGRTFGEREKCANISDFSALHRRRGEKEMENNIVR